MRTKTFLLRLTETENNILTTKSSILGLDKSTLLRNGAFAFWDGKGFDADALLKEYQNSDENNKIAMVDLLCRYYRFKGYPYNKLSSTDLLRGMKNLSCTKSPFLDNNHLQSNTVGLTLANHFHPHMVKVKCLTKYRSPYEQFSDDDLLKDCINRWMELGKKPNSSGLRRILRTRDGVRSVVNFKPAIAKYFYDNYCPKNGRVLDPCAGYGGRLAGCIASNKGISYHGIDPQGDTAVGNMRMAAFYSKQAEIERMWKFDFRFDLGCAEDIMPTLTENCYDIVFTSPPYFNVEKYDTNPNQSYLRYPSYEKWRKLFLEKIIVESGRVVKKDGYVIFNVKNYKNMAIADDVCYFAELAGLQLIKTYKMRLANSEYNRKEGQDNWHTEPIFVFQVF